MKLYIHIPFCASKCAYCDFYSTPRREWMESYIGALEGEWRERSETLTEPIDTLYIGGGTPSSLPPALLSRMLAFLPLNGELREATIEVNPEDINAEYVKFLLSSTPLRRVSMGIQSFSDSELASVGRRHTAAEAKKAYEALREGGTENISCDLIYGLPGQTAESWGYSLSKLISLRPEHISAYLLSYEPGTKLYALKEAGKVEETNDETLLAMYDQLCRQTRDAGYSHYEISNFALSGHEAIHNSSYWDGSDYIGLGPGAHSLVMGVRSYNPPNLKEYILSGGRGVAIADEETLLNRYNDMLITRLRTRKGLSPATIEEAFGTKMAHDFQEDALPMIKTGRLAVNDDDRYMIPEHLWLESNAILLNLIKV